MFDKTTHNDEEASFSDAYRSEILDKGNVKEERFLPKLISILLLIIIISAISIFGYKYFDNKNSITIQSDKKEIVEKVVEPVAIEKKEEIEESALPKESMMIDDIEGLELMEAAQVTEVEPTPEATKNDIDQIANQMKLELAKELDIQSKTPSKEKQESISPTSQRQKGEELYMKELEELSREIEGDAK